LRSRIYVERFNRARGRHVEVQVLGDGNIGNHLGTRDCSISSAPSKLVDGSFRPRRYADDKRAKH